MKSSRDKVIYNIEQVKKLLNCAIDYLPEEGTETETETETGNDTESDSSMSSPDTSLLCHFDSVEDVSDRACNNWRPNHRIRIEVLRNVLVSFVLRQLDMAWCLFLLKEKIVPGKVDDMDLPTKLKNYLKFLDLMNNSPYSFSWLSVVVRYDKDKEVDTFGNRYLYLYQQFWAYLLRLLGIEEVEYSGELFDIIPEEDKEGKHADAADLYDLYVTEEEADKSEYEAFKEENFKKNAYSDDVIESIYQNLSSLDNSQLDQVAEMVGKEQFDSEHDSDSAYRKDKTIEVGLRLMRIIEWKVFFNRLLMVRHKVTRKCNDGYFWGPNNGLDFYHLDDHINARRYEGKREYHFKEEGFPSIHDARVMQLQARYFHSEGDVSAFEHMLSRVIHFTPSSIQPTGNNKYAWNSFMINDFSLVHTYVFEGLRVLGTKIIEDLGAKVSKVDETKGFGTQLPTIVETFSVILRCWVPSFILGYLKKFGGLFEENSEFDLGYSGATQPIKSSLALSYLYSAFFVEPLYDSSNGYAPAYPTASIAFGEKSFPNSVTFVEIIKDNDFFQKFLLKACFTHVNKEDARSLLDPKEETFLFDVVLRFYKKLKETENWAKCCPTKWITKIVYEKKKPGSTRVGKKGNKSKKRNKRKRKAGTGKSDLVDTNEEDDGTDGSENKEASVDGGVDQGGGKKGGKVKKGKSAYKHKKLRKRKGDSNEEHDENKDDENDDDMNSFPIDLTSTVPVNERNNQSDNKERSENDNDDINLGLSTPLRDNSESLVVGDDQGNPNKRNDQSDNKEGSENDDYDMNQDFSASLPDNSEALVAVDDQENMLKEKTGSISSTSRGDCYGAHRRGKDDDSSFMHQPSINSEKSHQLNEGIIEESSLISLIDHEALSNLDEKYQGRLKRLYTVLDNYIGSLKDLSSSDHSPHQNMEPVSFIGMIQDLKKKSYIDEDTTFLDLGSGNGIPCFICSVVMDIPSFGIEVDEYLCMCSLLGMKGIHEEASNCSHLDKEDPAAFQPCHFVHFDIMKLKSLDDFRFIFIANLG